MAPAIHVEGKRIQPGSLHVIVASRVDGPVGLFYSHDPGNWLAAISTHVTLDQVEVRPSRAAARVVDQLRARFAILHTPSDALPWYLIDMQQAIRALNAIDLETGELVRDLAVG